MFNLPNPTQQAAFAAALAEARRSYLKSGGAEFRDFRDRIVSLAGIRG